MMGFRISSFRLYPHFPLLLVLIVAASLLSWHINDPWIYSNDSNGPMHGVFAKNYVKNGYSGTLLGQRMSPRIWEEDLDSPTLLKNYVDHPPLVPLLVSFNFRLFGVSEASTRLVAITFSLLSIIFIYLIGRKVFEHHTAVLAIALIMFMPMFLFFGTMTNHEVVTNFFILAAIHFYLSWVEGQKTKYLALLLISVMLGMWAGWPAYYLAALLAAHFLFFIRGRAITRVQIVVLLPVVALVTFALFLLHIFVLEGAEGLASLSQKFFMRSGGGFSWTEFCITLARYFDYGFTPVILLLALFCIATEKKLYQIISFPSGEKVAILYIMYGVALIHVLLFKQGALEHPYWIFYFMSPIAICAGRTVHKIACSRIGQNFKLGPIAIYGTLSVLLIWFAIPRIGYFYSPNRVEAFRLGQLIYNYSRPGDAVVLSLAYQGTQLPYYADRDLRYGILTVSALQQLLSNRRVNYRYYVVPRGQAVDAQLQDYLKARYVSKSSDGYTFYDLQSP